MRHTKEVFWLGQELLNHPMFGGKLSDIERDICRAAIILHDPANKGLIVRVHHNRASSLVRELLTLEDLEGPINAGLWGRMCSVISTHMGPWTKNKEGKEVLPALKMDFR